MYSRVFAVCSFLVSCASIGVSQSVAQSASNVKADSGVVVVRFNWYDDTHAEGWDEPFYSAKSRTDDGSPSRPAPINRPVPSRAEAVGSSTVIVPPQITSGIRVPRKVEQYVYRVKIKNNSPKRIEAIAWDYIFLDAATKSLVARHRFRSTAGVSPNDSMTVTGLSVSPPTKVVSAKGVEKDPRNPFEEHVIIKCVAYADGTVWQHPLVASGGCGLRAKKPQDTSK